MKKLSFIIITLVSVASFSQNKEILYNFTSVPQSLMLNPGADFKYNWYVGVPLFSGISANIGSSGFSAYDLFANNGVDFNIKLSNVVSSASRSDKLAINEQIELFNGGFRIGEEGNKAYISFGMYQELDVLAYLPKDPILFALNGNKNYLGKVFNLGDLNMKGEMISVFHLGYHKNLTKNLILGVRGKIYSSIVNFSSTQNSGYFYTIPGTKTIYDQVFVSDILINTSGISKYSGNIQNDITKKMFFGGDLGLGMDAGITFYPEKNIQFTASIVDIGFIRHTINVKRYTMKGNYEYQGITPNFITGSANDIYNEIKVAIPTDTSKDKYTTWRPVKFNSSYQYSFGDDRNSDCSCEGSEFKYKNALGMQLFAMTTPRSPFLALTGYYNRQIFDSMQMKATYTIDSFSNKNVGLGVSSTLGKANFYLMADNLLSYADLAKANSLNFQLGLNLIFDTKNKND